jgi:hypothetical protein
VGRVNYGDGAALAEAYWEVLSMMVRRGLLRAWLRAR